MAINEMTNLIVMVVFGILIGAFNILAVQLMDLNKRLERIPRREGQSLADFLRQRVASSADSGREHWADAPVSGRLMIGAFYGLILVLVFIVWASPVSMRWWWFLGSFLAGGVALHYLFTAARSQRIGPGPDNRLARMLLSSKKD